MEAKETVMDKNQMTDIIWEEHRSLKNDGNDHLAVAKTQAEISFKAGIREVVEFAIQERRTLKEKKKGQKQIKPDDIQAQIIIGSKMKALQQIIDKGQAKLKEREVK